MSIFKIVHISPTETQVVNLLAVRRIEKNGSGTTLVFENNDTLDITDSYEEIELFLRRYQQTQTPIFQGS